jgi:hypothetical protein
MNLKPFILLFLITSLNGCIELYTPQFSGDNEQVFVITGEVTDQPGYQEVDVSMASPLANPQYLPVNGCDLEIRDDNGHTFALEEYDAGKYRAWIDEEYLNPGTSYSLQVTTPNGEKIVSDYDRMPTCPEIDSVYFARKDLPTNDPQTFVRGVQFYVDLNGQESDSRFYRWNMDETWEYHSPYAKRYYYDGTVHEISPPDFSKMICWKTEAVKGFYTLSTKNLETNQYKMLPLHFEDNTTTKLYVGCSVLVHQNAISEPAYLFWEKLRINSEEQGGLYEKQPLPVEGNLVNLTNPGNKVLGFFGASSERTRRIFVEGIHDMGIYYDTICSPTYLDRKGWLEVSPSEYPVDFAYFYITIIGTLEPSCIDCQLLGGTLTKPDFWPH